jgi:hypothetical protein
MIISPAMLVQLTAQSLIKVVQVILTLMSNHKSLQSNFVAEGKEVLITLNHLASKALDGSDANKCFTALITSLAEVPETVQQRGEGQVDTFKTLVIKCLTKLTKQHFRADAVRRFAQWHLGCSHRDLQCIRALLHGMLRV